MYARRGVRIRSGARQSILLILHLTQRIVRLTSSGMTAHSWALTFRYERQFPHFGQRTKDSHRFDSWVI